MNTHPEILQSCPGCRSSHITVLNAKKEYRIFVVDGDEMDVTIGLAGCEDCGLTFLNPKMPMKQLFSYYSKQSRIPRSEINASSPFSQQMDLQVNFISKFIDLKDGMRVLEIGCAEGFFLKRIKEISRKKLLLSGVELSKKYLEQAKKIIPEATLYSQALETADFAQEKFDVIVLRHVFEHLSDPSVALRKISEHLAPQGVLYIEVPDAKNINVQLCSFYHHEHLLYFTTEILDNYLASHGLATKVCERFEGNKKGSGFDYPVIRAISKPGEIKALKKYPGHAAKVYADNLLRINSTLNTILSPIKAHLNKCREENKKIALFGAGPHTMEVMAMIEDLKIDWILIFDNNPHKHGKKMRNIPIVKPTKETMKQVDSILVSSADFEREMVEQIKTLSPSMDIIKIYHQ